ncbi:hypothetical protein KGM_215303 [Danaus plexippus plexippus]|uniref:Uncharacterized protein n=1 Tax=Danaus plexippus plexippus TaxID=278856 RepID=A0A212F5D1_DANPL|nr:hypothetical protein KGM_215303 [Danaus plexippus plexippus]
MNVLKIRSRSDSGVALEQLMCEVLTKLNGTRIYFPHFPHHMYTCVQLACAHYEALGLQNDRRRLEIVKRHLGIELYTRSSGCALDCVQVEVFEEFPDIMNVTFVTRERAEIDLLPAIMLARNELGQRRRALRLPPRGTCSVRRLGASKAKFIPDVRVEGIRVLIPADKNGIRSTAGGEREDGDGALCQRETETERSVTYPTHEPRVPPVPEHRSLTSRLDARLCVRRVSVCVWVWVCGYYRVPGPPRTLWSDIFSTVLETTLPGGCLYSIRKSLRRE